MAPTAFAALEVKTAHCHSLGLFSHQSTDMPLPSTKRSQYFLAFVAVFGAKLTDSLYGTNNLFMKFNTKTKIF